MEKLNEQVRAQLEKVLLYQPDILISANFKDQATKDIIEELAKIFGTGVNRVESLDQNFYNKNLEDFNGGGFGKADFALIVSTQAIASEGLHLKMYRHLVEECSASRLVLDFTDEKNQLPLREMRTLPKYNFPGQFTELLKEMEDSLMKNPEKKWYPQFAEHLDWLPRNVVQFDLDEFNYLIPYHKDIAQEYSKLVVVDTSQADGDTHPLQQSKLIGRSMSLKAMGTGYVHVDCLSGCGKEIPSVSLKGNGSEGVIVVGSHCDSCGNEYKPNFPNTTLKQFLSQLKI